MREREMKDQGTELRADGNATTESEKGRSASPADLSCTREREPGNPGINDSRGLWGPVCSELTGWF
jgi:hypothetical protein